MKDCIHSYRKNYPQSCLASLSDEELANCREPHWMTWLAAWTACNTVYREKYKRERGRRIVAEEKLTELIDPRR